MKKIAASLVVTAGVALVACSGASPAAQREPAGALGGDGSGSGSPGAPAPGSPTAGGDAPAAEPSGGSSGAGAAAGGGAATSTDARLAVKLVDAPTEDVRSVVVTIARVEASIAGSGWQTLVENEATVDLLTLQGGASLDLGTATLPPGHVDQLRLFLKEGADQHVTTTDGQDHPLEIPSGDQSGIKLVGGFDVPACSRGQLTLDFDANRSIQLQPRGNGASQWTLRPVVRIKAISTEGACEDAGAAEDSGAPDAEADAGSSAEPFVDPCAQITCGDAELCADGVCVPAAP